MNNLNAQSRIQTLFTDYYKLLIRNRPVWIIEENHKLPFSHINSAVRTRYNKRTFRVWFLISTSSFAKGLPCISQTFCQVFNGFPARIWQASNKENSEDGERPGPGATFWKPIKFTSRDTPICPWEPHHSKGMDYLLKKSKNVRIKRRSS